MFKFSVTAPNATYTLQRTYATMDEGVSNTITLNTTGVQQGQQIPYTISGTNITLADFSTPTSLSGVFTVRDNTSTVTITTTNDNMVEGNEQFTLTLENGVFIDVNINDTSALPTLAYSYDINQDTPYRTNSSSNWVTDHDFRITTSSSTNLINVYVTVVATGYGTLPIGSTGSAFLRRSIDNGATWPMVLFVLPTTITGYKTYNTSGSVAFPGAGLYKLEDSFQTYAIYFTLSASGQISNVSCRNQSTNQTVSAVSITSN